MMADTYLENDLNRTYRKLLKMASRTYKTEDLTNLKEAYNIAHNTYLHFPDVYGRPFIFYPLNIAQITAREFGLGISAIIAGLLYEAFNHNALTEAYIKEKFGETVSRIITGLHKIENIKTTDIFTLTEEQDPYQAAKNDTFTQEEIRQQIKKTKKMLKKHASKSSMQIDNYRRMLISLSEDIHVILLEIVFHLYKIRNIDNIPSENRLPLCREVAYIYTPMAHKLGLYNIKTELEDTTLQYLEPKIFKNILNQLEDTKPEREAYIKTFIKPIKEELGKNDINYKIKWRTKSIQSIRNKIKDQSVSVENVYDIFAIRIILTGTFESLQEEKAKCWETYSLITDLYTPNKERLRDWVSLPRDNGYESLHTTVMGPENRWVEVQIRTQRMDHNAEKGTAAHWRYKNLSGNNAQENWLTDIRELLENTTTEELDEEKNTKLPEDKGNIFVFTPKNELKRLPEGASVLDFAYTIHSKVGETCTGGRINNKIYPIKHKLKNGDTVEIITSKQQKPKREWINYVVSNRTKQRIKRFLNAEKNILAEKGRKQLTEKFAATIEELSRNYPELKNTELSDKWTTRIRKYYGYRSSLELFGAVGEGKVDMSLLKTIIEPEQEEIEEKSTPLHGKLEEVTRENQMDTLIISNNLGKIDVAFAKCCNPIPGDKIFGFVSASRGTKIHKITCPNAPNLLQKYPYRIVKAQWNDPDSKSRFMTTLRITCKDKVGILAKISQVISGEFKINIGPMDFQPQPDGLYVGKLTVYISKKETLNQLMQRLNNTKGIIKVTRKG